MKLSKQDYEIEVDGITTSYYPELTRWLSVTLEIPEHNIKIVDFYGLDIVYIKYKDKKEFDFVGYVDYILEEMIESEIDKR